MKHTHTLPLRMTELKYRRWVAVVSPVLFVISLYTARAAFSFIPAVGVHFVCPDLSSSWGLRT